MKKILFTIIIIIILILLIIFNYNLTKNAYNKCLQNSYSKTQCNELKK